MDDNKVFDDKPLKDAVTGSDNLNQLKQPKPDNAGGNIQNEDLNSSLSENFAASQFAYSGTKLNDPQRDDSIKTDQEPLPNQESGEFKFNKPETVSEPLVQNSSPIQNSFKSKIEVEHDTESPIQAPGLNQNEVDPPGPRAAYDHPDIAPDHQQTYEESMFSADAASQISQQAESKNRRSMAKILILSLVSVLLIAGIVIGAYFYIKITNSPKYVVGKSFENLASSSVDVSVLYQTKNGNVYDDKLKIEENYDGNNDKSNVLTLNLDDAKTINLNLSYYQSENYFKFNGLQASAAYFQPYSQSLSQTVGSSGVVLDNQWVKLNDGQNITMPTDIIRASYGLADAVDQDSITLAAEQGQNATYSFKFNRVAFNSAVNQFISSDNFNYLDGFNIQNQVNNLLQNKDVNDLQFSVIVNRKSKTVEKITISDQNQVHIVNLNFKLHEDQSIDNTY